MKYRSYLLTTAVIALLAAGSYCPASASHVDYSWEIHWDKQNSIDPADDPSLASYYNNSSDGSDAQSSSRPSSNDTDSNNDSVRPRQHHAHHVKPIVRHHTRAEKRKPRHHKAKVRHVKKHVKRTSHRKSHKRETLAAAVPHHPWHNAMYNVVHSASVGGGSLLSAIVLLIIWNIILGRYRKRHYYMNITNLTKTGLNSMTKTNLLNHKL